MIGTVKMDIDRPLSLGQVQECLCVVVHFFNGSVQDKMRPYSGNQKKLYDNPSDTPWALANEP